MSITDKFNATRKLREGEREEKRERERERERKRERDKKWTIWRVRSFAFGSVENSRSYQIRNKRRFQRRKKSKIHFFSYIGTFR
jgi:hypothetical protein